MASPQEPVATSEAVSAHSSAREKVLEHLFVGELLRCLWQRGIRDMEVLRAEVDMGGYDLVLEANGVLRYIQLKSSEGTAKTARVPVNINLERKPGGCVIWMRFDPETLKLEPFWWFGGGPREPVPSLGEKRAKHTKGDSTGFKAFRPNIRILPIAEFTRLDTIDAVVEALFFTAVPAPLNLRLLGKTDASSKGSATASPSPGPVSAQRPAGAQSTASPHPVPRPERSSWCPTMVGNRALGSLLGLAVGDALGTTLEFKPRDSYEHITDIVGGGPFGLKPGQWTDDTSMALCLAESLVERGGVDAKDLMERFRRWRDDGHNSVNGKCFDIGNTTTQAITRYVKTGDPLAGSTSASSAGNGSIMRLAPVPIFYHGNIEAAEGAAVAQSRTTHGAGECLDACRLMTRIIVVLLNGAAWPEAIAVDPGLFTSPKVKALAAGSWREKSRAQIRSSGYVIDTLEAALWAVHTTGNFREALLLAVNLGEDADTVGAVTGQLAGARYGVGGIPPDWLAKLAWSERMAELAKRLMAHGQQPHDHKQPSDIS